MMVCFWLNHSDYNYEEAGKVIFYLKIGLLALLLCAAIIPNVKKMSISVIWMKMAGSVCPFTAVLIQVVNALFIIAAVLCVLFEVRIDAFIIAYLISISFLYMMLISGKSQAIIGISSRPKGRGFKEWHYWLPLFLSISAAAFGSYILKDDFCESLTIIVAFALSIFLYTFVRFPALPGIYAPVKVVLAHTTRVAFTLLLSFELLFLLFCSDPLSLNGSMCSGTLTACKSNLKNLGTSLEMYSTDFYSRYPDNLIQVMPNYLKVIPTCPNAGTQTYVYTTSPDHLQYTIYCKGNYHKGVNSENYPQYDSMEGLIER